MTAVSILRDRVVLLLLGIALATSACASTPDNVMRTAIGEEGVQVTVENNDFRDATIYANWNGFRQRVGMVTGKTTETFTMDWRNEWVQLQVDFIGGGGFDSDVVDVYEGDHLQFVILPQS